MIPLAWATRLCLLGEASITTGFQKKLPANCGTATVTAISPYVSSQGLGIFYTPSEPARVTIRCQGGAVLITTRFLEVSYLSKACINQKGSILPKICVGDALQTVDDRSVKILAMSNIFVRDTSIFNTAKTVDGAFMVRNSTGEMEFQLSWLESGSFQGMTVVTT